MIDPRLEDHAVGVEAQLIELVERRERAEVQGRDEVAASLEHEIDTLHEDLASTADQIAKEA